MNTTLLYIVGCFVRILPPTRCFSIKRFLYRFAGANIGSNVRIVSSVRIYGSGKLTIGDNTWIGHGTTIIASADVFIGKNVDIAPNVFIGTGTHIINLESPNIAGKGVSYPICIEDGAWLCACCTILPGSKIGKKCVIASGAVLKGIVPDFELWGGVLAKKIKNIQ